MTGSLLDWVACLASSVGFLFASLAMLMLWKRLSRIKRTNPRSVKLKSTLTAIARRFVTPDPPFRGLRVSWTFRRSRIALARAGLSLLVITPVVLGAWDYRNSRVPSVERLESVHVVSDIGKWEYWLETPSQGKFFVRFCQDQAEPEFSAGQDLIYLKYVPAPNCWAQAHYKIVRGSDGKPTQKN